MNKILLGLLVSTAIISCSNGKGDKQTFKEIDAVKKITENSSHGNQVNEDIYKLSLNVILRGDKESYNKIRISYLAELIHFLPYALIMSKDYNYTQAYYDVYFCLALMHDNSLYDIDGLDEETKKVAITYLKQAANKGHKQAKEILGGYYIEGKYVPKDTIFGKRLIDEGGD